MSDEIPWVKLHTISQFTEKSNSIVGIFMEGPCKGSFASLNEDGTVSPLGDGFKGELVGQNFVLMSMTAKIPGEHGPLVMKVATKGVVQDMTVNKLDEVLKIMGVDDGNS